MAWATARVVNEPDVMAAATAQPKSAKTTRYSTREPAVESEVECAAATEAAKRSTPKAPIDSRHRNRSREPCWLSNSASETRTTAGSPTKIERPPTPAG